MGDTTCYCILGLSTHFILTAFFAVLLSHRIYKRAYYDLPLEDETQNIHGPFEINLLKPSDFVEISFDEWIEYIHTHYADKEWFYAPSKPAQIEAVDDFINQLSKAGLRYFQLAMNHQDPDYHHEL